MPKTKPPRKALSSSGSGSDSDSDSSGPRDRNPPSKKAKTEPESTSKSSSSSSKSKSGGGGGGGSGGQTEWQLDKKRVVKINDFRGRVFVDIREYYEKDGEMKPGKKGISLSTEQYRKFKEIMPEIDEALKNQ